jgi:hypothetical protein
MDHERLGIERPSKRAGGDRRLTTQRKATRIPEQGSLHHLKARDGRGHRVDVNGEALHARIVGPCRRRDRDRRGRTTRHSIVPQYLQCLASASCPCAAHAGHAWVDTVRPAWASSTEMMPVGTARML